MSVFRQQLEGVAGAFEQWGECERTVVACTLARRVPWPGLRLLQRAVDAALTSAPPQDELLEREANDEALLAALLATHGADDDEEGERLQRLLTLLPLLRPDNERAKDAYVHAVPALVQRCVDAPFRRASAERCRQLLCYLLVHPALAPHDHRWQATLSQWLHFLESHLAGIPLDRSWQPSVPGPANIWGSGTFRRTIGKNVEFRSEPTYGPVNLQESFSKNGRDVDISLEGEKLTFDAAVSQPKAQRSNSLTPPSTNFMLSSSAENLSDEPFVQKPRSFSLSSEHSLSQVRPMGIMYGTTGSETRLDELRCSKMVAYPGMSTVAQWLKSLRLHKYVWLFTNISYEQMMAIDEEYLEKLGVTTGARHKLLLSIGKLRERRALLTSLVRQLSAGAAPGPVLSALRHALLSPMPPRCLQLPRLIVAALELASTALMSGSSSAASASNAASAANASSASSAPGASGAPSSSGAPSAPGGTSAAEDSDGEHCDPLSLHCWLVEQALHHESFAPLTPALRRLRHRLPPRQFYRHVCATPLRPRTKHRWRTPPTGHNRRYAPPTAAPPPAPRPKSHSYPPPRLQVPHDYASLDALCLQMTEQAIN